jgi:glucose uptake protein GlcU
MSSVGAYLAAFVAAIAFGVQYTPVKRHAIHDGSLFQWAMCSGIGLTGFVIALLSGDLENGCPRLVVLGGALWALSNYAVIPLVKILGIGLGFSLYHFVNLVVGYLTGRLGFFGVRPLQQKFDGSLHICDLGCFLVAVSFVVIIFVEVGEGGAATAAPPPRASPEQPLEPGVAGDEADDARSSSHAKNITSNFGSFNVCATAVANEARADLLAQTSERLESGSSTCAVPAARQAVDSGSFQLGQWKVPIGILLAVIGGGLAGVQTIPATLYMQEHRNVASSAVVFPQCLGIWAASSMIYLLYGGFAKIRNWKVQHSVIRPSYFAGCIWGIGFYMMVTGIHSLGYAIGYTLDAVGPIVVASILSIFVFKEIQGRRQLILYCVAEVLQLVGVLLMVLFGENPN